MTQKQIINMKYFCLANSVKSHFIQTIYVVLPCFVQYCSNAKNAAVQLLFRWSQAKIKSLKLLLHTFQLSEPRFPKNGLLNPLNEGENISWPPKSSSIYYFRFLMRTKIFRSPSNTSGLSKPLLESSPGQIYLK